MSIQTPKSSNVVWQPTPVTRLSREEKNGHKGAILWFTGLSGAGKSTLALAVEERLHEMGCHTMVLDGDNVRHGLCGDLGFSNEDREENIRRIGELAKLFLDAGIVVLTAFISPFQADRDKGRSLVDKGDFIEVYCDCSLAVCEERDVKGLYKKARDGVIKEFTGISSPYEAPANPELNVDTGSVSLEKSVEQVLEYLADKGICSKESIEATK
ncbi:MAG: adenylyl-sulfate kinase [Magnetococcales bacterium]|nr:adenylyl-sulfate kinase [Magnetococcales bacterium]